MRAAIYARVSTTDKGQDPEMQLRELRAFAQARGWTISAEYVDHMTGSRADRPQFKELVKASRERRHDIVLVWKLDRFSRSLRDLLNALQELQELDIAFVSLKDNIDLTTSAGRLMAHMIGAFAEFERDIIRERVKAGLENARAKGKRLGRRGLAPIDIKRAIDAYEEDPQKSVRQVAKKAKLSSASAGRILKDYRDGLYDRDGFRYENKLL